MIYVIVHARFMVNVIKVPGGKLTIFSLVLLCSLSFSKICFFLCSFPALSCEFASVDVSDILGTVSFNSYLIAAFWVFFSC